MAFNTGNVPDPTTPDFLSFLRAGPTAYDFAARKVPEQIQRANSGMATSDRIKSLFGTYESAATPFSASGLPIGFSTLNEILFSQGRTDPALLNRQLADISRTTQGRQDALTGTLAAQGVGRSIAGSALNEAIAQSGAEQRAQAIAQENALAEQRKRDDLNQMLSLYINPAQQAVSTLYGVPSSGGSTSTTDQILALLAAGLGSYLGACWVAAEVFDGWDDPRTHAARRYILTRAPRWFREGYLRHGQAVAERVRRDPALRDQLRPLFVAFARLGR